MTTLQDQSKLPDLAPRGVAAKSSFISNLPIESPAYLHPMQVYFWLHDLRSAVKDIFQFDMPDVQARRFELLRDYFFIEDYGGRSTGKTMNYYYGQTIQAICLPYMYYYWLGQDKTIGQTKMGEYFDEQIDQNFNFRRFLKKMPNQAKPKVAIKEDGAELRFLSGSLYKTMSPNPRDGYKKMQTWRGNGGIFNEWTSWPNQEKIEEIVEPIFTKTNYPYRNSRLFRESIEKYTGVELGKLSNENLAYRHKKADYEPRRYMSDDEILPEAAAVEKFHQNFATTFGFEYSDGVRSDMLHFEEVNNLNDIVVFFLKYDEGDTAFSNNLIYDGSAKRPSDPSYQVHKSIAKQIENGSTLYAQYSISIDDIPVEWDGIIFESVIIEKARRKWLKEDFDRVYGGKWVEGRVRKPFIWQDFHRVQEVDFLGMMGRENPADIYIGAGDAAQGTDKTYSMGGGLKDSRGDDADQVIMKLGKGTREEPHKLIYVRIAEDVRSEPVAYDIQDIELMFGGSSSHPEQKGIDWWMFDPGGHGKAVVENLAKRRLEKVLDPKTGEVGVLENLTPIVPIDRDDITDAKQSVVFYSLSSELIKAAYIESKSEIEMLKGADMLNNLMVEKLRTALRNKTFVIPDVAEQGRVEKLHNEGKITDDQLVMLMAVRRGISQLTKLNYKVEKDGKRSVSSKGVFMYDSKGKKDVGWTILMCYLMCDIIVTINKKLEIAEEEYSYVPVVG